jgi:NAD kinase
VVCLQKVSVLQQVLRGASQLDAKAATRVIQDPAYVISDQENSQTANVVAETLQRYQLDVKIVERLTNADVKWADLVLSVGGDGTFLRACRAYSEEDTTLIMGVNSSPSSSFGFFCLADSSSFTIRFAELFRGGFYVEELDRMKVLINGSALPELALNDVLFAHEIASATARYKLFHNGIVQKQQSSGVWIATSAGSTGAIHSAGGDIRPLSDRRLQFRVRELFKLSLPNGMEPMVGGFLDDDFSITSRMDKGALYLDGNWTGVRVEFHDKLEFKPSIYCIKWICPPHEIDHNRVDKKEKPQVPK